MFHSIRRLHLRGAFATESGLQCNGVNFDVALYCILGTAALGNTLRGVGWLGGDQGQGERRCECYTALVVHCCSTGGALHRWYTALVCWYTALSVLVVQEEAGGKVSAAAHQWCLQV